MCEVGDKVQIINKGKRYTAYTKMYDVMKAEYPEAKPYATDEVDDLLIRYNDNDIIGIVRCTKEHLNYNDTLALVEIDEYSFIFNVEALKIVPYTIDDFEVGDIVEAIDNDLYYITNKKNEYVGKIISKEGKYIYVETISFIKGTDKGHIFEMLLPEHFKLHNSNRTFKIHVKEVNIFELFDK